ncbi:hypothetical protein PUR34_04910 [Streptomyces sp. JV185]|uniref:hypothetical protein n=1 Tax=Streptomyces sp. JV185 TaxID=858638 RepID=UPI002E76FCB9|nr:hypothetical protein [Streptomyces sp. JV185]MEE1767536.1 hypothetical protein [Streptomyces sp. JV185]
MRSRLVIWRGVPPGTRGPAPRLGSIEHLAVPGTPAQRWEHVRILAAGAVGLLHRCEEARATG